MQESVLKPKTFVPFYQLNYILEQTTGSAEELLLHESWNKSSVQAFF